MNTEQRVIIQCAPFWDAPPPPSPQNFFKQAQLQPISHIFDQLLTLGWFVHFHSIQTWYIQVLCNNAQKFELNFLLITTDIITISSPLCFYIQRRNLGTKLNIPVVTYYIVFPFRRAIHLTFFYVIRIFLISIFIYIIRTYQWCSKLFASIVITYHVDVISNINIHFKTADVNEHSNCQDLVWFIKGLAL